jgi:hypothetical protein
MGIAPRFDIHARPRIRERAASEQALKRGKTGDIGTERAYDSVGRDPQLARQAEKYLYCLPCWLVDGHGMTYCTQRLEPSRCPQYYHSTAVTKNYRYFL